MVDANSFMTPFRFFYAFDLVPAYWKALSKHIECGRIVVLDMVRDEINKGEDDLAKWMNDEENLTVISHIDAETVSKYQEIMQYVSTCGYYKPSAFQTWAPGYIADPWLIASAGAKGFTLITEEVSSGGLSLKNPNRSAKIPDVAKNFGVKTANIYYMMRKLGIRI